MFFKKLSKINSELIVYHYNNIYSLILFAMKNFILLFSWVLCCIFISIYMMDQKENTSNEEESIVINAYTGENVPEGFYDEVLADGYTYNNPKPIPESWIIEPAGDGYPATIDYYKFFDEASESQTLPGSIGSKTAIPDYMYGYSPRTLDISFRTKPDSVSSKADFAKWFKDNYDLDFLYVTMNNSHNYGGRLWSIYVTEGDLQDIKTIQSEISSNYHVRVTNLSLYLPKYRGTDELKNYINIDNSSYRLFN